MTMRAEPATLLILTMMLPGAGATAEPDGAIVVTGNALPLPAGAAAYGAVTLEKSRLEREPSGRLENVLRDVAGFQQFRVTDSRAANPTSQGATVRGLGGNASSRTLVLLDGVPAADPFAGYIPWAALAPGRLGAARITRGGGAGPFGSGAVAGVIELFSAGPGTLPRVSAEAALGMRGGISGQVQAAGQLGGGFGSVSARFDRGDGYVLLPAEQAGPADQPARYRQASVAGRAVLPVGDAELQASALAFTDRRRRGLAFTDSLNDGADASMRLVRRGDWGMEALAYVQMRRFTSGFASANAGRSAVTRTLDQYNTPALGIGGKLELRPPAGRSTDVQLGLDARHASGETRERFRFQGGDFTRLREAGGRTLVIGAYAEASVELSESLTLTGGARIDRWRITGGRLLEREFGTGLPVLSDTPADRDGWEPTGRAGMLARLSPMVTARGAAYLGWRLPTLNELYRPFRVGADATAANADLAPERLRGVEAGLDISPSPATALSVTLFHNELRDAIGNVTLSRGPGSFPGVGFVAAGGAYRQRLNLGAIVSRGLEVWGNATIGEVVLAASYALTDARVRGSGTTASSDGLRPAQTALHQASASLGWSRGDDEGLFVVARYIGRRFEDDLQTRRLDEAMTIDASAQVLLGGGWTATLRAENVFDVLVQAGVSESGIIDRGTPRTIWAGLRYELP